MKVLIAIDGSDCSEMALQSVKARYWPLDTEFRLINVFEPMANQCYGWHTAYIPSVVIDAELELETCRRNFVTNKVEELQNHFPNFKVHGEVISGSPWRMIVDDSKDWQADLIVVGSHGRSGFSKLFLGSVAEAVASHANCSVEIIKGHALLGTEVA